MRLRVSAGIWCSCRVTVAWFFCGRGATLVAARETQRIPALRGSSQRAAAPATLFRPPGRPCRKESQTFSLISFRILWIASAVGCQSTHARLRSPRLLQGNQPPCLQKPLEPETTAGQPAPVSTKAPEPETTAGQPSPRVYKSSWNPETTAGQPAPCLQKQLKSWTTWDNQSHSNPDLPVY